MHKNFNYSIIEDQHKLNLIYIPNKIIIISNHGFLSLKRKVGVNFQTKDIGLIISSKKINEIYNRLTVNTKYIL